MNLETIRAAASNKAALAIFKGKKYSPQILFGAGVVGFGATVVLAVRATNKVSQKVDDAQVSLSASKATEDDGATKRIKLQLAGDIAKQYALPVAVGLTTLGCFGGAHYILNKRNGVLLAAYGALHQAHSAYRKRVVEEYGEDIDRKFALGGQDYAVTEKMADGSEKMTLKTAVVSENGRSPYAQCFDEKSRFFTREPGMNTSILEIKRGQANDKLMGQGHLFLNEAYDLLGLPRTPQGAIVGWIYDPRGDRKDANLIPRDHFVTFGLWENDPEYIDDLIDGRSKMGIWLDFNVEGPIWDKI